MGSLDEMPRLFEKSNEPAAHKLHERPPTPSDFEAFLPWACHNCGVEYDVIIARVQQSGLQLSSSDTAKPKTSRKDHPLASDSEAVKEMKKLAGSNMAIVFLQAVYDKQNFLIQIVFFKNKVVPRQVMKILTMMIPFYPRLTTITIDHGLKHDVIHELEKLLSLSNVTEMILDNTRLIEASYYLLLDNSRLKYLSLARCTISDIGVENIALRLIHPPASENLSILNLSSNKITDEGAKHLGDVLKLNRKLTYLNLADNYISDIGADSLLSSLMNFPLTSDDIRGKKERHISFLKMKKDLIQKACINMRENSKKEKNKPLKTIVTPRKSKIVDDKSDAVSTMSYEAFWQERAEAFVEATVGSFVDPYHGYNIIVKDDAVFCLGNNTLSYLNLAYNNLTYLSVRKLLKVLYIQDILHRTPKGLMKVIIEGNKIPVACPELKEIDNLMEASLATYSPLFSKKRRTSVSRSGRSLKI